jgi:hypothetical protein
MEKTKGNLKEEEESFLSHTISELRLNYVDEVNKAKKTPAEAKKTEEKEKESNKEKQHGPSDKEKKAEAESKENKPS